MGHCFFASQPGPARGWPALSRSLGTQCRPPGSAQRIAVVPVQPCSPCTRSLAQTFLLVPSYTLMESVASMDANDREAMSQAIGMNPLSCKLALHLVSTTEVVLDRLGGECSACSGAAKLGGRDPRRGPIGGRSGSVANGPTRLAQGRALPIFPYLYDFTASGPAWTEAHRHPELHP